MNVDGYLTAKREYCAACGGPLGSARYLVKSGFTGKYEAVHHTDNCLALFKSRNTPDPLAPGDTTNDRMTAPLPLVGEK